MAMGQRGRREAENAIACCRPFRNSTGSLSGTRGSTRDLGWLSSHRDARRIKELLSRASYVVWSYETPIAFVSEDDEGNRTAYYVDEPHSTTTANHQCIARMGMGEYETIGSETRRDRERENRRRAAVRRREAAVGPAVENFTPGELAARTGLSLVGSPGYQNGFTEGQQERNLAALLDPRFANPDWTPFPPLPREVEERDLDRINREERTMDRGWTP